MEWIPRAVYTKELRAEAAALPSAMSFRWLKAAQATCYGQPGKTAVFSADHQQASLSRSRVSGGFDQFTANRRTNTLD